jgi:glycosyltransferase involved in cell wall biosynthesis
MPWEDLYKDEYLQAALAEPDPKYLVNWAMKRQPQSNKPSIDPSKYVSILVSSHNTKLEYIQECLESITNQVGGYHMELVWINDGSDPSHTEQLLQELDFFERNTPFSSVIYSENDKNMGLGYSLNRGINLCSHEMIVKMDSDDIMHINRIQKQMEYMIANPEVQVCGTQIQMFKEEENKNGQKIIIDTTTHKSYTWNEFKAHPTHWFMNHPTLLYRKSAVLQVGNYDTKLDRVVEDFNLELRLLKTFGYIHNFETALVKYRLHDSQVTKGDLAKKDYWNKIRADIILSFTVNRVKRYTNFH